MRERDSWSGAGTPEESWVHKAAGRGRPSVSLRTAENEPETAACRRLTNGAPTMAFPPAPGLRRDMV